MIRLLGRLTLQTEQKYPVLLEYAKASFERNKQRLRHLWALARIKRVLNDCTLASDLDRQFGDMPVLVARDQQNSADNNLDALAVLFAIARAAERDPNAALN